MLNVNKYNVNDNPFRILKLSKYYFSEIISQLCISISTRDYPNVLKIAKVVLITNAGNVD